MIGMRFILFLAACLQVSAEILENQSQAPLCGECLAGFQEFDAALKAGDQHLLTAKVLAACGKYTFFMSQYPLAHDLCASAGSEDSSSVVDRVADYVATSDTCGHMGFCKFDSAPIPIPAPQDMVLLSLQSRATVRHRTSVASMAQVLAHKSVPPQENVQLDHESANATEVPVKMSDDESAALEYKDDLHRFYSSRHAVHDRKIEESHDQDRHETREKPASDSEVELVEEKDSAPQASEMLHHHSKKHASDHWCITTMAGRHAATCEALAEEVEVESSDILDVHNGQSCDEARDGPHDAVMFRCSYADLMEEQRDSAKSAPVTATATATESSKSTKKDL